MSAPDPAPDENESAYDFDAAPPARVAQVFDHHLAEGLHHGAQLAVYRDGDLVLDRAGGRTGPDGAPTDPDTRHVLFSCTKPYAAVCLHQLVERGAADYDDLVVEHWPAFAAAGAEKAAVTLRHVLSHRAGLSTVPVDEDPDAGTDWDRVVEACERADLRASPGERPAYHALSFGWLVGELVRRLSGTPIREYAREHLFDPLGMDRTSVGLPAGAEDDVATLTAFADTDRCIETESAFDREAAAARYNREATRRAVIPAANGVGTAREIARFYACLANGGELEGVRMLEPETVDALRTCQAETPADGTLGSPARYGLGVFLGGVHTAAFGAYPPGSAFGHAGLGSSVGWADPEAGMALAYVTNGMRDGFEHGARASQVSEAARRWL
jgi:CubicO group peptidase (beta-lactamase class C family)